MTLTLLPARSFVILGLTLQGRPFRPSDWAERLCGVMAQFRPPGAAPQGHLTYSPFVHPAVRDGVKCVRVDARLHDLEPMAYHFLVGFVRDNELQVVDAA
jgi:hypothetical protein